jgi:hypothetical protein
VSDARRIDRKPRPARRIAACSCAAWLAAAAPAQTQPAPQTPPTPTPAPQQNEQPAQEPKPAEPAPQQPNPQLPAQPSDADRAADALRKALGLKKGPVPGDPNAKPPTPPATSPDAAAQPTAPQDPQRPQEPTPIPTAPNPERPAADPSNQAADSLRDLMPRAVSPQDPAAPPAPEPPRDAAALQATQKNGEAAYPVHGSIGTRFRSRDSGSDKDQDLGVTVRVDAGDKTRHAITSHFAGRGFLDLDGIQRGNSFNGLDETYNDSLGGYVYAAHADLHRIPSLDLARVGRQSLIDTPQWLDIDGAYAESKRHGMLRAYGAAYVGAPVRYWDGTTHGDRAYGAAFGLHPWQGGRMRFDWMHIDDDVYAADGSDDLLAVQAWHAIDDRTTVYAKHTWLDGNARDLVLRGQSYWEQLGIDGSLTYRELLSTQSAQTTEFDPYSPILVTYAPYRQIEALATKQFGERWAVSAGCDARQLRDDGAESQFNREYTRFYAGPSVQKLFGKDLTLSGNAERWNATDGDYTTFSGDLRWRASPLTTATMGTSYARFAYDAFAAEERDNVRSWYLRVQHRPKPDLRIDGTIAHEQNDIDSYVHFRIGATWTF